MFSRRVLQASHHHQHYVCLQCTTRHSRSSQLRLLNLSTSQHIGTALPGSYRFTSSASDGTKKRGRGGNKTNDKDESRVASLTKRQVEKLQSKLRRRQAELKKQAEAAEQAEQDDTTVDDLLSISGGLLTTSEAALRLQSLKQALLRPRRKPKAEDSNIKSDTAETSKPRAVRRRKKKDESEDIPIGVLSPDELDFEPIKHEIPPVPKLSHGLDRVLFNPGVYRLQDPRSRVYNFDPYLEKIMPVAEFDFNALSEYKTSSKDPELLALTKKLGTKFTGSTSSMSGVLQHFHFILSKFRRLNHDMLSRKFPSSTDKFSKITRGPTAIFLRWKDGQYAIDADKSFDSPNIMSWLGHSLEKLLTNSREEFERYRRSSPEAAPDEDESGKCFHYSKLGNFLMRSQLDAQDSRLPGTGVFDLKTRAVVSIRMDHTEYETGSGYQIRFDRGEWESYEREFYDMTRATMLKYSLQVRMGRMDGIFVAYHNIERIFGFQYFSLPDMDEVLHGQSDTCLGDQEFRVSVRLLDETLQRATEKFPETSLRLHFHARDSSDIPYMYVFAEPVTEEQADEIQNSKSEARKKFERDVVGVQRDDPEVQAEWQHIQSRVDEEVEGDELQSRSEEIDEYEGPSDEDLDAAAESDAVDTKTESNGPLMGWTLTVLNRVNGEYVDRPENLTSLDRWTVEYNIKEIAESQCRKLYEKVVKEREAQVGQEKQDQDMSLKRYREMIQRFSKAGRQWREQQDKIDAKIGQRIFRPLGPGSEEPSQQ